MEVQSSDPKSGCALCGAQFNHRSSLIRHIRNKCNKNKVQRRKSCAQCVANKSKCNLKRPTCSRCALRQTPCEYDSLSIEQPEEFASLGVANSGHVFDLDTMPTYQTQHPSSKFDSALFEPFFADFGSWSPLQPSELALRSTQSIESRDLLDFMDSVTCPSPGFAQSELAQPNQPSSDSNSVALANHSMELIFRVFRTWPQMLAEGFQLPPIFHSTQLTPQEKLPRPLATCITLAKMWHGQCSGAEDIVRATIHQELAQVIKKSEELDEETLLASLQAVVIYTIILLSPSTDSQNDRMNDDIVFRKVELFVWHVVRGGLFLSEERAQTRPSWEAWVHVTSKRRAILTLYLLHWAYSVLHKVPCFDCRDLGFMPAPAPKVLWQAHTEQEWNTKYIHWLARWSGQIYLQAEFGHILPGAVLSTRAEKWLGEADEFGFIMASILNATDFEPPGYKERQKPTLT